MEDHPLQRWMRENELTQEAAAKRFGVTQAWLSRLLLNKADPSANVMRRIARETNGAVTPNDFFRDVVKAA
jgi:transcriptional regulator with XRE-family HTH domain